MGQKTVRRSNCPICKKELMPWQRITCKNSHCRAAYFEICSKVKTNLRPISDDGYRPWSDLVEEEYERNYRKNNRA